MRTFYVPNKIMQESAVAGRVLWYTLQCFWYNSCMTQKGTIRGNKIEMDDPIALPTGTRVEVEITPEPAVRKGSPEAILRLAGTLTDEEAEMILAGARSCRSIDPDLWRTE
jgi:hypothetical protein